MAKVVHMPTPLPLRIFVACPSDLNAERAIVKDVIDEYNSDRSAESNITFELVEWAQIRGTARRPQESANELIPESHFMVVLFRELWGSNPGGVWGYTSGTEEELFNGLVDLAQPDRPMRDIWVGFLDGAADPRISSLRQQMIDRNAMLFEDVPDVDSLRNRLRERLRKWEPTAHFKQPRQITLIPSSGRDVLSATGLRLQGEKLMELGQADPGHLKLQEAAEIGGPLEHLALARSLARRGDFDGASEHTQAAIDFVSSDPRGLYIPLAAETFAAQAGMLRRRRRPEEAVARLLPSLDLLVGDDSYTNSVRARIYDELGLARHALGELDLARRDLEGALRVRLDLGNNADLAQSLINLARLEVAAGNLDTAVDLTAQALERTAGLSNASLRANAEALHAQIELRRGSPELGVTAALRSLALNEQIGSLSGMAIAELLLAQCYRAIGDNSAARVHAARSLANNVSADNAYGIGRAQWLLDQLDSATD